MVSRVSFVTELLLWCQQKLGINLRGHPGSALLHLPNFIVPTIRRALFKGARVLFTCSLIVKLSSADKNFEEGRSSFVPFSLFWNPSAFYFLGAQFHFHRRRNCFKIVFKRNPSPGNHALNRGNRYPLFLWALRSTTANPQISDYKQSLIDPDLFSNTCDRGRRSN